MKASLPDQVSLPLFHNGGLMGSISVFVGVSYEAVRVAVVLQHALQLGDTNPNSYHLFFMNTGELIDLARVVTNGDGAIVVR